MPAPTLLKGIAVLILVAAATPLLPQVLPLWWALLVVLLALAGVDLLTRPAVTALVLTRETAGADHVGRRGSFTVRVRNQGTWPLDLEVVQFLPPGLEGDRLRARARVAPAEERSWQVPFVVLDRGEHALPPTGVAWRRPHALLEYRALLGGAARVLAVPGRPAGEMRWLMGRASLLAEAGARRVRQRGAGHEFESMREYVPGDEPRTIDWKASARRHRPQVRQFRIERSSEVVLALDCGRLMGTLVDGIHKLDLAMTPLLDLAAVALRRGERVGFLAFDSKPLTFLPPRSGLPQLARIAQELASLSATYQPTSYLRAVAHLETHHRKRAMMLLFTDFTDEISAAEVHASLRALARRHLLVFVGVNDAHLRATVAGDRTETRVLLQKAVAAELLAERRRVLASLRGQGIHTVDAEPRALSGPLLRTYLELRLRGLL